MFSAVKEKLNKVLNDEVSDTTGDAMKNKSLSTKK
jgi:hypothetical protein